jgi:hypothetical protein
MFISFKEITIFKHTKRKKLDFIPFDSINDAYILENYCLDKGHSNASIGFYIRPYDLFIIMLCGS